jgi:hypothetical protein
MERAHEIAVEAITPGMVLAEDVFDQHGHMLMPQGAALSPRHKAQLLRRGVTHLVIDAERQTAQEEAVRQPFTPPAALIPIDDRDPFMRELIRLARMRFEARQRAHAAQEGKLV